jgi:hypothetical protein
MVFIGAFDRGALLSIRLLPGDCLQCYHPPVPTKPNTTGGIAAASAHQTVPMNTPMKKLGSGLSKAWRALSVGAFIVLMGFWCIRIGYCVYALMTNGIPGAEHIVRRGMTAFSNDPRIWGEVPWSQIVTNYILLAFVTVLLWRDNRQFLRGRKSNVTQL